MWSLVVGGERGEVRARVQLTLPQQIASFQSSQTHLAYAETVLGLSYPSHTMALWFQMCNLLMGT